MPETHASRGTRRGRRLLHELGAELRTARLVAGLTQAEVAAAAGIPAGEVSRSERGLAPWLDIVVAARLCAVVGLDLSVRAFPGAEPLRDSVSLRLFDEFGGRLGPGFVVRMEVPIGDERDQRAWDMTLAVGQEQAAVEFESRFADGQALLRRVNLKRRDSGIERVVLVFNDTNWNWRAVAAARDLLRATFPLDAADVLFDLRAGRLPRAGGIVFLRPRRPAR